VARAELSSQMVSLSESVVALKRAYHGLLGLCKVVAHISVEDELAERSDWYVFDRNDLRRVQQVDPPLEDVLFLHDLYTHFPLRVVTRLNGIPEILTMEIRIFAIEYLSLRPDKRGFPLLAGEMELDKLGLSVISDEPEGVHAESIHVSV
jgi:hypothetical protein